jgi:hypothetical protein
MVKEKLQAAASGSKKFKPALVDSLVVFKDQEFFVNNYTMDSGWALGDLIARDLDAEEEIDEVNRSEEEQVQREEQHKRLSKEGYFLPNLKSTLFDGDFIA